MRALVTGACGFVGGYLCRHLLECGDGVLGTIIPSSALPAGFPTRTFSFETVELDIGDVEACAKVIGHYKPDVIFHLAGLAFVPECEADFGRTLLINVAGTDNIFRVASMLEGRPVVVLISSAEVYGKILPSELPVREDSELRPLSNYSLSKQMAEMVALRYEKGGRVRTVIMRPFNHIGPGQNHRFVSSSFALQLAKIEKKLTPPLLTVGNLDVLRDFSDVRDIVRAYRLGALKGSGTYNLGSGCCHSVQELLDSLIYISGLEVSIHKDPKLMRPSDNPKVYGSIDKASRELGWQPEIPFNQTLKDIYEYWRKNTGN